MTETKLIRLIGLWCLGSHVALVTGEAVPRSVSALRGAPDRIDGDVSDRVWSGGGWHTGLTVVGSHQQAAPQTRFKIACDDKSLYFAVVCSEPRMDQLRAKYRNRDDPVFADDCIEIFLSLAGDRQRYVHLGINSNGAISDGEYDGSGRRNTAWDSEGPVASRVGTDSWAIEVAIPLYQVRIDPRRASGYAFNVTRQRKAGQPQLSTFAPLTGGFHNPARFAGLKLPGADISKYAWQVMPIFGSKVVANVLHAETRITNSTGRFWPVEVLAELALDGRKTQGEVIRDMFDAGQTHDTELCVPLPGNGEQTLTLTIRSHWDQELRFRSVVPLSLHYAPIVLTIRTPAWRNTIFSKQAVERIELGVECLIPPDELAGLSARVALSTSSGKVIAERTKRDLTRTFSLTLPADTIEIGECALTVSLEDEAGKCVHTVSKPLRRVPPSPCGVEWWFDENHALFRNGERFLPYGAYGVYPDRMETAKEYYSAALWYATPGLETYLECASRTGLSIIAYPYWYQETKKTKAQWHRLLNAKEIRSLTAQVGKLAQHPSMLAWYLADEPGHAHLPRMAQLADVLAEADPYRPTIILVNNIASIHWFGNVADILMSDPYPGFVKGGLGALPIEQVSQFVKACREATHGRKPVWVTLQGMNWNYFGRKGQRAPNLTEARNMNYQAVVHGATGFLWYGEGYLRLTLDLVIGVPFLAREMQMLKDFVLSRDVSRAVRVDAPLPEHMHVSLRRSDRGFALFAVNTATSRQTVAFELHEDLATDVSVVSEKRQITLRGRRFADTFDVYATHTYTDIPGLADALDLAATSREIREADARRKAPGNIAFEDSGVEIAASPLSNESYLLLLLDGMREVGAGWYYSGRAPAWLVLTWPETQRIGRVVLYNFGLLADFEIQIPRADDDWATVASVAQAGDGRIEVEFPPVRSRQLRIYATKLVGARRARVSAVEVFSQ